MIRVHLVKRKTIWQKGSWKAVSDWDSRFGMCMHQLDMHVLFCFLFGSPLVPHEPGQVVAPYFAKTYTIGIGFEYLPV